MAEDGREDYGGTDTNAQEKLQPFIFEKVDIRRGKKKEVDCAEDSPSIQAT